MLQRRARDLGRALGETARAAQGGRLGVLRALEDFGFEPRADEPDRPGASIVLGNCPFHTLARQHTELVCGMNLCLLDGLLDGLAAPPDLRRRCREVTLRPP